MKPFHIMPRLTPRKWQDGTLKDFKAFAHTNPGEFDDDVAIQLALDTAADRWENLTDQATEQTTYTQTQNHIGYHDAGINFGGFTGPAFAFGGPVGIVYLMRQPFVSLTSVTFAKSDGTQATLTQGTDFDLDSSGRLAEVRLRYPLAFHPYNVPKLTAVFVAGLTPATLPARTRFAVFSFAKHLFENREAYTDMRLAPTPGGFEDLAQQDRHGRGWL